MTCFVKIVCAFWSSQGCWSKEKLNKVWNLKSVLALLLAAKWSVAKCILLTNWKTFMLHTLQFSQLACLTLMNYFSNNIKWSDKAILRIKKRILMPCHANKTVTNCVLVHGTCFYITVFDHCTFFVSCNSFFLHKEQGTMLPR